MRERLLTSTGEDEVRGSLGKRQVVSGEGEGVWRITRDDAEEKRMEVRVGRASGMIEH